MTDAQFLEMVKTGQAEAMRGRTLISNLTHDWEHYGNLVTYLRLKKLVPPRVSPGSEKRERRVTTRGVRARTRRW